MFDMQIVCWKLVFSLGIVVQVFLIGIFFNGWVCLCVYCSVLVWLFRFSQYRLMVWILGLSLVLLSKCCFRVGQKFCDQCVRVVIVGLQCYGQSGEMILFFVQDVLCLFLFCFIRVICSLVSVSFWVVNRLMMLVFIIIIFFDIRVFMIIQGLQKSWLYVLFCS